MPPPPDFNGDGVPDVALGWDGSIDIVYLQDDAADPVLGRRAIAALEDVPIENYVPKASILPPYTNWPLSLEVRGRACGWVTRLNVRE